MTSYCFILDIEAQIREIQERKRELTKEDENGVTDKSRIGLGESGYFDQEIYDGGGSKFEGYVTSIAANDEVDVSNSFIVYIAQVYGLLVYIVHMHHILLLIITFYFQEDDYEVTSFNQKRPGYTAPAALLNDIAQSEKDYDPFADRRRPTIAEKEDEYRQKRRRMIISPERIDPFAEGIYF